MEASDCLYFVRKRGFYDYSVSKYCIIFESIVNYYIEIRRLSI